jgi:predicted nucleotidyltransferase
MDEVTFQSYVEGWKNRQEEEKKKLAKRAKEAKEKAEELACILIREHGASEVWLFGSLLRCGRFHANSDIDLAAGGLHPSQYFSILSRLNSSIDFDVDLIDLDACPSWLALYIRQEGILLDIGGEKSDPKKGNSFNADWANRSSDEGPGNNHARSSGKSKRV